MMNHSPHTPRLIKPSLKEYKISKYLPVLKKINELESCFQGLSDAELRQKTDEYRRRHQAGTSLKDLLPEAYALVREATKRTLGLRLFDVQILGGILLQERVIAEIPAGEGKTILAILPLYLNALAGKGVHLATITDYLVRRDARWVAPVFHILGMSVGVLQKFTYIGGESIAYVVDTNYHTNDDHTHQLRPVPRKAAYQTDVTYGSFNEYAFDLLRDSLSNNLDKICQIEHAYALIDEVDVALIDMAYGSLTITGTLVDNSEHFIRMKEIVQALDPDDVDINAKDNSVSLTLKGKIHIEALLDRPLFGSGENIEDFTPEQANLLGYLEITLRAHFLYHQELDYVIEDEKVIIRDRDTGNLEYNQHFSNGLHQAIEAKEGLPISPETFTQATITARNYFPIYRKVAGMTGTATKAEEEFQKLHNLRVVALPTNLLYQSSLSNSIFACYENKDKNGYKYRYYARKDDPQATPIFFQRIDYPDLVYQSSEAKLRSVVIDIIENHLIGRPVLIGTDRLEISEKLANRLRPSMLNRLMQTLIIRDRWMEENRIEISERAVEQLLFLNQPLESLSMLHSFGQENGFSIQPLEYANLDLLLAIFRAPEASRPKLIEILQKGIENQVLLGRKHTEESEIIGKAGALYSVTIMTKMAGRGVDIKLGGYLDDTVLVAVHEVLRERCQVKDPFALTLEERWNQLCDLENLDEGPWASQVKAFMNYMHCRRQVYNLGGLYVIGMGRNEARRIDNQVRGRCSRQGDPGASRFYLSLEDNLMRAFGGSRVDRLLAGLQVDDNLPLESPFIGNLIENTQKRVEGANFDVRKHLLKYDDVLNEHRQIIYEQRHRILSMDDLGEDLLRMLHTELQQRVPVALKDEEGPWKLVAYIDEIQPPVVFEDLRYPSLSMRLLVDQLNTMRPAEGATVSRLREELLSLADHALAAEREHMLKSFQQMLERSEEELITQRQERFEALDNFIDTLSDRQEDGASLRPQELSDELAGLMNQPKFRLNDEQIRLVWEDAEALLDQLRAQVNAYLMSLTIHRVVGAMERRLGESLNVRANQFQEVDWLEVAETLMREVENVLERQFDHLLGSGSAISRDLDPFLDKLNDYTINEYQLMDLLGIMMQGQRMVFDRKTHRQDFQVTRRLNYAFLAGQSLQDMPAADVSTMVLKQLEGARDELQQAWGRFEWTRLVQNNIVLIQLDRRIQARLTSELGKERFDRIISQPLTTLDEEESQAVRESLGWFDQNEATRQLLLSVISDLWVDYLTRVEALRVSIGLEAYAQRDPLVQYKGRASEMFQQLLADIRMGVISRLFTFRPRSKKSNLADSNADSAELELR